MTSKQLGSGPDGDLLSVWTCARSHNGQGRVSPCKNIGITLCTKCHQVKYCSKDCQNLHRSRHSKTCSSPYAAKKWEPTFEREGRPAAWMGGSKPISFGKAGNYLWGNMPAFDALNVPFNEGAAIKNQDIALCFAASGDLRNVIKTINGLPADYSGKCTLVINDFHPLVAIRTVILLCILLGTAETSEEAAAEVALHALYSSKLTTAQDELILSWIERIKNTENSPSEILSVGKLHFSSACSVEWAYPPAVEELLRSTGKVSYSTNKAEADRRRIMIAPERLDYRERYYTCLRRRHRVGFAHQRETGILLPLGQPTDSFCVANRLLYSEDGEWLLKDNASPASAWAPLEVEAMRQTLDLPDEDYIGSLFFYIKAQLTEFARRARRFNLVVVLSAIDMQVLPELLDVMGMPDLRFDRVETSNVMDTLGPSSIISVWGPRLNRLNPHSALLMYSMNWPFQVWGGTAESQGRNEVSRMISDLGEYLDYMGVRSGVRPTKPPPISLFTNNLGAFFDTSSLFRRYLFRSGVPRASWSAGVEERKVPRIMPSRLGVRIYEYDSSKITMSLEEFYFTGHIFFPTWHERFVEFGLGRVSFLQVVASFFIPSNILWAVLCLSVGYFLRGYIPLRWIL